MIEGYVLHLAILICIYVILALSLNIALGYTGLLNLGHIAFFGIGAYTSALLTDVGLAFPFAFLCAGLLAAMFGYLLVIATNRLKGDYLALATLGFSFVIYSLMLNWTTLTRGPLGLPGITKPILFGIKISSNLAYFLFALVITIIFLLLTYRLIHSPFGRLMQATRDDELGLRVLGKNTFKVKAKAMTISAFWAGIAGSLFAHYITYIDPTSFYLADIILLLTIVIVGGIASMKGSVLGTIIILLIPEALRLISLPAGMLGPLRQMVYAVILIAILLIRPRGILGKVDLQ